MLTVPLLPPPPVLHAPTASATTIAPPISRTSLPFLLTCAPPLLRHRRSSAAATPVTFGRSAYGAPLGRVMLPASAVPTGPPRPRSRARDPRGPTGESPVASHGPGALGDPVEHDPEED